MSSHALSLIRTWVPIGVGWLLGLLAGWGIGLDADSSVALSTGVTALVTALYYLLARWLERRWPQLGWLLGAPSQPIYAKAEDTVRVNNVTRQP